MQQQKCGRSLANCAEDNDKSAATNAVTFSTMDARRDDGNVYSIAYIEKK